MLLRVGLSLVVLLGSTHALAPPTPSSLSRSKTALALGIPKFLLPDDSERDGTASADAVSKAEDRSEKKIGLAGILQLMTAGAGAPFLGDFEGVDKETGKFMFSLEANNLVDEEGQSKQTKMPYFENGWVDPEDEKRAKEAFKFPWQK
jgi:hypothetical protein